MDLENCWKKEKNYFSSPSLLDFWPTGLSFCWPSSLPLAQPVAGPSPSRSPARTPPCALRGPATVAVPPSPAADARAPHVGAVPFLPRDSETARACAMATAAHVVRRGSVPAPRPRFKGVEPPPRALPCCPRSISHSRSRHGGRNRRTEELRRSAILTSARTAVPEPSPSSLFPAVRIPSLSSLSPTFSLGILWLVWPCQVRRRAPPRCRSWRAPREPSPGCVLSRGGLAIFPASSPWPRLGTPWPVG